MVNLNTLLYRESKDYLLFSATAINDRGQIAATAYDMPTGSGTRCVADAYGTSPSTSAR